MTFKFNFSYGEYYVNCNDEQKQKQLQYLQSFQEFIFDVLPHRRNEINRFIIACVDEIISNSFNTK